MMVSSSCLQVVCGVLALTVAILTGALIHLSAIPSDIHIHLDPNQEIGQSDLLLGKSTATLTSQQIDEYHRDGAVFVRGLLSEEETTQLKESAIYTTSRLLDVFGLFGKSRYKTVMFDLWRTSPDIAFLSLRALPKVAAQLMTLRDRNAENIDEHTTQGDSPLLQPSESIRLLRDAFFAYQPPGEGCGWHVDDAAFWPAVEDTTGPTFWIALDPLLVQEGGGLAVLNRTLFRQTEPLELTEDICRQTIAGATCDMPEKSPECHAKMEATKMQFDMRPGDAIIWDRFTFHRGVAGTDLLSVDDIKQRYSVRYMPKSSKAFGAVHSSVEQLGEFDSAYYPQVWPNLLESEMKALEHGLDSDITLVSAVSFLLKRVARRFTNSLFSR
jgi:Phytanoyl-CoA dioxygenase (PhyH)